MCDIPFQTGAAETLEPPNPRVQRTHPLASLGGSPLTRSPLDGGRNRAS